MALDSKQKYELKTIIKELEQYRGRHTELVSVYVPSGYDINKIVGHLCDEQGTANNIKSPGTRKNVIDALDFLKNIYKDSTDQIGDKVVVIGGGFTAVDAARSAKRLGAKEVYIAYRRTRGEMPAGEKEIAVAEDEGIKIMYLVSPVSVETKNGKIKGIKMVNQTLGEKDSSLRRRPEEVPSAEFVLSCDTVITAIGQKIDNNSLTDDNIELNSQGMIKTSKKTQSTSIPNVYAAGDATGIASIIDAAAGGKNAAASIDKLLNNKNAVLEYMPDSPSVSEDDVLKRTGYFKDETPIDLNIKSGNERINNFSPHVRTMTEEEAVKEADRCLNCGCGVGCGICAQICSAFAVDRAGIDSWKIDEEECVACGMCFLRCPNDNIEMIDTREEV